MPQAHIDSRDAGPELPLAPPNRDTQCSLLLYGTSAKRLGACWWCCALLYALTSKCLEQPRTGFAKATLVRPSVSSPPSAKPHARWCAEDAQQWASLPELSAYWAHISHEDGAPATIFYSFRDRKRPAKGLESDRNANLAQPFDSSEFNVERIEFVLIQLSDCVFQKRPGDSTLPMFRPHGKRVNCQGAVRCSNVCFAKRVT